MLLILEIQEIHLSIGRLPQVALALEEVAFRAVLLFQIFQSLRNVHVSSVSGGSSAPQYSSSSIQSRSKGDYSNQNINEDTIKDIPLQADCYDLVSFSNNPIGYKGVDQLLYGQSRIYNGSVKDVYQGPIVKNTSIVILDLSNCNIGGLGSDVIGQAMCSAYGQSSLRFLQHLNLSNNNIDDAGIYSFGNNNENGPSPCLRSLNLSNNKLTDNGASSFYWTFKKNNLYYLNHLDLSGNNITDTGKAKLAIADNEARNPNLVIILEKQSSLEGVKSFMKKSFSYYTGEIKKFLDERQTTSEEVSKAALKVYGTDDWAHCKKFCSRRRFFSRTRSCC